MRTFRFYKIASVNNRLTVGLNGTDHMDLTVVKANLAIAYSQLTSVPTEIVKTNQANTYSSGVQLFQSSNIKIRNPADTFSYTIVAAAIAADRSLTLPLLTATDTVAVLNLAQTFTNKVIAAASNTITGLVDANIDAHTSTKITITDKTHLHSAIAYTDATVTMGDFNLTLKDNRLVINNPADTFTYTFIAAP